MSTASARDELRSVVDSVKAGLRYKKVAAAIVVAGTALTLAAALLLPRRYASEAVLLFQELVPETLLDVPATEDRRTVGPRLRDMLLSRRLLQQVVEGLNLYPGIRADLGDVAATEELRKDIQFSIGGEATYRVRYVGRQPAIVQSVTERLTSLLIERDSEQRIAQATATRRFLEGEAEATEAGVRTARAAVTAFIGRYPEYANRLVGHEQRSEADAAGTAGGAETIATLRREREALLADIGTAESMLDRGDAAAGRRGPALSLEAAQGRYGDAMRDFNEISRQLTEQHPDVVAAKQRLAEAKARYHELQKDAPPGAVRRANEEPAALRQRLKAVDSEIAAATKRLQGGQRDPQRGGIVAQREARWQSVSADLSEAELRHEAVRSRLFVSQLLAGSIVDVGEARLQVIDPAYLPAKPSGLPRSVMMLLGFALAVALAVAVVLVLTLLDDRIHCRRDLERLGVTPLLVEVPTNV